MGKTPYEAPTRTRTHERAVRGYVKKNGRRPSWTEREARHGKLGKTMYDANERTRTRGGAEAGRGGETAGEREKRPKRKGKRKKTSKWGPTNGAMAAKTCVMAEKRCHG